jgi:hypothetical protein
LDNVQLVLADPNDHSGLFSPQQRMDAIAGSARAGDPLAKAITADSQGIEPVPGPIEYVINGVALGAVSAARALGATTAEFATARALERHAGEHAAEFGLSTSRQYLALAQRFFASERIAYTRANGDRIFYNLTRNEFGVLAKNNVIRTFFRPNNGAAYFAEQLWKDSVVARMLSGW